jgi:hypothetical protein
MPPTPSRRRFGLSMLQLRVLRGIRFIAIREMVSRLKNKTVFQSDTTPPALPRSDLVM